MKKNNIKTKIIAGILSAITVCSIGAMTTTTAFAAETHISTGTNIINDNKVVMNNDLKTTTKLSTATLFKVLEQASKYGKYVTPALGVLLEAFVESPADRIEKKLDEVNGKIDKIFDKIDASEASIKAELTNDIAVQSFYNTFTKFKAQTRAMHDKIKDIYASNLTDEAKAAKIAALTGNSSEWRARFEDVLNELNSFCKKPSMTKDGTIFDLIYKHYTNSVMLSGEALDLAKPVSDHVMQVYTAGCATLVESLSAQLYFNALSADAKAKADPEFAAHICKSNDDIQNEIKAVTKLLTGDENSSKADTVKGMYDKTMGMARTILVNKGHDNIALNAELKVHAHQSKFAEGVYNVSKGEKVTNEFNREFDKTVLNLEKAKLIADYAKSKGIALRKLLESCGFNVSKLPQNANLVTAKAWDDSVTGWSRIAGYNYQKSFYKGFNIDKAGAGEANAQLLDCGYNSWKFSEWNYMVGGNACILTVK